MPKPIDNCRECGAAPEGWRQATLDDFTRLGVGWGQASGSVVQDGMDALTWIERYDVHVCGNGHHMTETRRPPA